MTTTPTALIYMAIPRSAGPLWSSVKVAQGIAIGLYILPARLQRVVNGSGWLDYEEGRSDWQKRLLGMLDGMPDTQSEAGHLIYIYIMGEKELALDGELANEVRRRQLDFLIVDSASFSVSKTSDAEAVNAFFGQLGQFGCGSLILAYVVKSGRKEADMPFGSTSWHNQGRCGSSGTMRRPTVGRRCGSICGRLGWS